MAIRPVLEFLGPPTWLNKIFMKAVMRHTNGKNRLLAPSDFYVAKDIKSATTLPASAFSDKNFLELELNTIFKNSWILVPERAQAGEEYRRLSEMVSVRGAHSPFSLLGRPLFLQRDWKNKLHCFPNVCTHAWYPLVEGPGRQKTLVCPQHGRSFDCEGNCLHQTGFDKKQLKNFPRDLDHLKDLPVQEWNRFIFTSLGQPFYSLKAALGSMQDCLAKLPLNEFKYFSHGNEIREVEGNWKQHAWNYMDTFHITFIHRAPGGLADAIEMSSYRTVLYPFSAFQYAYARNPDHGFDPSCLPSWFRDPAEPQKRIFALWWFVFPNMTFNFYPWGLSVNIYMPVPEKPESTLFSWHHYVWDEKKYEQKNDIWLNAQVDSEDVCAMRQVRRGVRSGFAPRGVFSPTQEKGSHWFHRLVYKTMFLGKEK